MHWKKLGETSNTKYDIPDRWLQIHYYEALNILFRVENVLRVFVYIILKTRFQDKWADLNITTIDDENATIQTLSRKRLQQATSFGYLGYPVSCPMMHLNSGELTRIITHEKQWPLFSDHFKGTKTVMQTKLEEIGSVRNALAHFRPIKPDDVEVIKQNSQHILMGIEDCVTNLLSTNRVVPTNSTKDWYKLIKPIGTKNCSIELYQGTDENWIRISITYTCPQVKRNEYNGAIFCEALNLKSPEILRSYPNLTKHVIYLSERIQSSTNEQRVITLQKYINLVFSTDTLAKNAPQMKKDLEHLLLTIETETELVSQDSLARGQIVEVASLNAIYSEENKTWNTYDHGMGCEYTSDDPPEYWGQISTYPGDFIAAAQQYPWMNSDISQSERWF